MRRGRSRRLSRWALLALATSALALAEGSGCERNGERPDAQPRDSMPSPRPDSNSQHQGSAASSSEEGSDESAPDLADMIRIPAGRAHLGCPADDELCYFHSDLTGQMQSLYPRREVNIAEFFIDRTEVTVAQYRRCFEVGACAEPEVRGGTPRYPPAWQVRDREEHPITGVTPGQAIAYCTWLGKRLPTADEWERAARGDDERLYPWGNDPPTCSWAHVTTATPAETEEEMVARFACGTFGSAAVGSYPQGASPYGVLDMVGNVAEWVIQRPDHPLADAAVAKGGGWNITPARDYLTYTYEPGGVPSDDIGFRCAYSRER